MARGLARATSCILILLLGYGIAAAEESDVLPTPLTLEYALSLLDTGHSLLLQARAAHQVAQARYRASAAQDDLSVSLEARARWVIPPSSVGDEATDDHKGSLFVRQPLYDFGRTSTMQQATQQEADAKSIRLQNQRDQQRLAIMRAYFNVLLADQENFRDNEAMAVSFITLDRLRNRQELGQSSDIEVLEQESLYQKVRTQVQQSESRQRLTRSQLANLLDRPGQLPSELVTPSFDHETRPLLDYDRLLQLAQQNNSTLQALQLELQAAHQRVANARSERLPRLDAELEASSYSRELGSNDRWRAGITLSVPIYNGDRVDAVVAQAQAEQMRLQGQLAQGQQELRQALLESWFALKRLTLQREQARSELDYRELYLDRSRAQYEMEVTADLGDAMVRLSDAQLALIRNDFDTALEWERLRTLVGVEMTALLDVAGEIERGIE